eukprot:121390-Rhodomonas_salina.1
MLHLGLNGTRLSHACSRRPSVRDARRKDLGAEQSEEHMGAEKCVVARDACLNARGTRRQVPGRLKTL